MTETSVKEALNEFLEVRWWTLALRGVFGIIFGIICFANPALAAVSLVLAFGIFSIADGIAGLMTAFGQGRRGERWVWLAIEAVASLVIGAILLFMPGLSLVVLYFIIAIKAAITGIFLLLASIKLDGAHGQGLMTVAGAVSVIFAGVLLLSPMFGAKILIWWIGAWAIVFGIALIALGFKLKSLRNALRS